MRIGIAEPKYWDLKMPRLSKTVVDQSLVRHDLETRGASLMIVRHDSPKVIKRAVHQCAVYFRREFGYDNIQYDRDEKDERVFAFLWCLDLRIIYMVLGACCFRRRNYTDAPEGYALQWIWFHPFNRNRGLLKEAWPNFHDIFDTFYCEPPFSPAMEEFLKRHPNREPNRPAPALVS